jgi:hypothetical protein
MSDNNVVDLTRSVAFAVTDKSLITVDLAAIDKAEAERRKAQDEAYRKAHPVDENQVWRDELAELERRLTGYLTPEACQNHADTEAAKHKDAVNKLEDEIAYVRSLLTTDGLDVCIPRKQGREAKGGCACDVCIFHRRINLLGDRLIEAKHAQQKSIRTCGHLIATAKELSKLIPRYQDLAAKAKKIDTARKVARGMIDGGGGARGPMNPARLNPAEQLGQMGLHSPHIKWEK